MSICTFNVQLKGRKAQGTICGLLFMILSVVVYKAEISGGVIPFAMGLLACVAVILMVAGGERRFGRGMDFLARYTMPIFFDAYVVCGTTEISLTEVGYRKFCNSCGAGTRN